MRQKQVLVYFISVCVKTHWVYFHSYSYMLEPITYKHVNNFVSFCFVMSIISIGNESKKCCDSWKYGENAANHIGSQSQGFR